MNSNDAVLDLVGVIYEGARRTGARIQAGVIDDEDTILDLVSYIVLLLVARDITQENP